MTSRKCESLPIDASLPDIIEKLRSSGAVVLSAQPGAGKTTRVPPAILDAGLGDLPNKSAGQIVVLQPRRIAARAAAARMSEERGSSLGAEIGYQVRHERRFSRQTRILVCTEGVFIRRLQDDPLLENTAVVVFDEFHERSLDSDLALAMVKQVRDSVRPDLRILVMSATLDMASVAQYLGNCPTIEVAGRTFGVEIDYLPFPGKAQIEQMAADGIKKVLPRTAGHLLLFLPGVGEIRRAQALLEPIASKHDLTLMPLYGDLPLEEQQRVLQTSRQRKVVLATNVAETSLTIDGVTAVVDSGLARISRFEPQQGLNRLRLERISQASANQRSGRAGRTAPGICLRLWPEREQQMMPQFQTPEIARVELSECMLQLITWGESNVRSFPWLESPPAAAVERALELLERLDALERGSLTELGKDMARLPLQPRLARLLVEGMRLGHAKTAALCAALLAEREPFRRDGQKLQSQHHSNSDVLDRLHAMVDFTESKRRDSLVGEVLRGPAMNIVQASEQFLRLVSEDERSLASSAKLTECGKDEAVMRALLTAFPDRLCRRREPRSPRAVMVGGRGVRLATESAVAEGELFVAVEFVESKEQSELLVRQASCVEREWLPQSHVSTSVDVSYDSVRERVLAMKRTRFCDLVIDEAQVALPPDSDPAAVLADAVASQFDLQTLVDEEAKGYLTRVQCLRQWLPELDLPDFGAEPWRELLPEWCAGCSSVADLRQRSLIHCVQGRLTHAQMTDVEREAPDRILVPSGRQIKIDYEFGNPPVLAVRIQELFGMAQSPCIARSRVPVLLHLLAPNNRVQQITPDLASFWKNTYPDVKRISNTDTRNIPGRTILCTHSPSLDRSAGDCMEPLPNLNPDIVQQAVGVMVFIFCVVLVFVRAAAILIGIAIERIRKKPYSLTRWDRCFLALAALGSLCILYGFFVEPYWLETKMVNLTSDKIDAKDRPVRIVHISDLHCDPKPRLEEVLPREISALKPDIILFTGDSINSPGGLPVLRKCLMQLAKIAPMYVVKGNWDAWYFTDLDRFGNTGVVELNEAPVKVTVGHNQVWIGGQPIGGTKSVRDVMQSVPDNAYKVFLFHYPDYIKEMEQNKIDLYLAGHTHGGQVALPFYGALLTFAATGKRYESGLYLLGKTHLYVNRGIGMEGGRAPRVRFWARPEITVIDISGKPPS